MVTIWHTLTHKNIQIEMINRFGLLPDELKNFFHQAELKIVAENFSVKKINFNANKISIFYNPVIDVLFNDKYNVLMFNSERIIQHESPLILAGNKNNYDIIKFLIEINNHKNPFHSQLDVLIEKV